MEKLKVIGWTSYDSACQNIIITAENMRELVDCLIDEIKQNGYVFCGDQHQDGSTFGVPVFNNGKCYRASMRAFAFIMALAHDDQDYMNYYMTAVSPVTQFKLPSQAVDSSVFVFHDGHDAVLPAICQPDLQILQSAMSMPFLTTDKALQANYEYMKRHNGQ